MASVLVDGKLEVGRVCAGCLSGGVTIVVAPARACACGGKATVCQGCVDKAADKAKRGAADAKALAKKIRDRAKAYARSRPKPAPEAEPGPTFSEGLEAGLEQAADFLEKGKW
jgi:hypothetical protein